jgi:hypothetical protein
MTLKISLDHALPLKFLSLRKVVFGGSGSGKTSFGRVLFEEATAAGVLCGAIDLKGDFWGLKSTADGQGDGIPIVIFGGEHQDVPLDENGGASLAEIVVELRQPFIVDLEQLSKGKQLRFLGAFFERLYDRNREPLVLFCDEADRYAPQKPMSPEANICLGAAEDVAKRGRKHGIFPVFITQRNASLNKGVSELCDVAIVFRTPGPRDQEAVEDWFGTKATREQRDEVMEKLAGLATGTAVLCSAHPDMKLFATVAIRQPSTFDSSATPEIGQRRIEPKRLAKPDLDKIQTRMAATIARTKAEDPRALRARIAELEREVQASALRRAPAPTEQRVEVPVLTDARVKRFEYLATKIEKILGRLDDWRAALDARSQDLRAAAAEISAMVRMKLTPGPMSPRAELVRQEQRGADPARILARPTAVMVSRRSAPDDTGLGAGERKMIEALALRHPDPLSKAQLGLLAGYAASGGTFRTYLPRLHRAGLVDVRGDRVALTPAGRAAVGEFRHAPQTSEQVRSMWLGALDQGPRRMLEVLLTAYPKAMTKAEFGEASGYEAAGGTFRTYLPKLKRLGLVEVDRDRICASETLFT